MSFNASGQKRANLFDLSLEELLEVQIVTAATGSEQTVKNAPSTANVIMKDQWQAMGANSLYEVLNAIAGIHIGLNSSVGDTSTIIMRGLGSTGTQVKVLINGQSFDDRTRARVKITGNIPLTGFKRIEIIKGPSSVVYGADAFAGVINLVTEETGSDNQDYIAVRRGSYNAKELGINHSSRKHDLAWRITGNISKSGISDRRIAADAQTGLDHAPFSALTPPASNAPDFIQDWFDLSNIMASLKYKAVSAEFIDWRNNGGIQLGITDRIDDSDNPISRTKLKQTNIKLSYNISEQFHSVPGDLTASYTYEDAAEDSDFMIFPANAVVLVGDDGNLFTAGAYPAVLIDDGLYTHTGLNTQVSNFKLNHVFDGSKYHNIRWEVGYETLDFDLEFVRMFGPGVTDSDTLPRPLDGTPLILGAFGSGVDLHDSPENQFLIPAKRNFWFASFQDKWAASKNLTFTLGIRHDQYSDFGGTTNPRASVNWQATDKLALKVFGGTAFRAPAFGELYSQNNPVIDGNLHLQPESIETFELGLDYDLISEANLSLSATLYRFKTDDLIQDLPNPLTGKLLTQNTHGERGKGFELEALWKPLPQLTINFSYARSRLENTISEQQRPDVPNRLVYLNANWKITQNFNANIGIKRVAGRERSATDPRLPTADYTAISARLAWEGIVDNLTLAISGTNIGNDYISEPGPSFLERDIPMTGSLYKLELHYVF